MSLDTEAPTGLIAFYQATANGKMSISSDMVTTQEYFADGRGGCVEEMWMTGKIKCIIICNILLMLMLVR